MDRGTGKRKRAPLKNLYSRGGVYYARLTVNGVEHRRSLKTDSRAEAERRLAAWLKTVSPYKGTTRHTWEEAVELWFAAGSWKPKTTAGYLKLLKVLNQHFAGQFWDQVDKAALQGFADRMRQPEPPKRMKAAGTATINRYLSVVSGIADHVRELPGWPEVNPVKLLPKKPRREKRLHYVRPPVEDIEAMFARMHGTFGDLCRFALLTGARKDEITTLKADDARGGKAQLWDTKHKFRVIPLNEQAQEIVSRQQAGREGYLFTTRNGGPYKRATEMWREIRIRAHKSAQREGRRFTGMRFHDLRHEFAIRYLESGGNLYVLQQLMGHSTIAQTEHYLRYLTPEQAARAKNESAQ